MSAAFIRAAAVCALCSCVTSGDLDRVAREVSQLEQVLDDETATADQLEAGISTARAEIVAVAEEVRQRTQQVGLSLLEGGGLAGGITSLGMLLLHQLRNRTRKRDLLASGTPPG